MIIEKKDNLTLNCVALCPAAAATGVTGRILLHLHESKHYIMENAIKDFVDARTQKL